MLQPWSSHGILVPTVYSFSSIATLLFISNKEKKLVVVTTKIRNLDPWIGSVSLQPDKSMQNTITSFGE